MENKTAIRAERALSLYGNLLLYCPHIKFLGVTFDNRSIFTKHFEQILERYLFYFYLKSSKQITMSHPTCESCGC